MAATPPSLHATIDLFRNLVSSNGLHRKPSKKKKLFWLKKLNLFDGNKIYLIYITVARK